MISLKFKQILVAVTILFCFNIEKGFSIEVINIDVSSILNSRAVTTYSNGIFYPWINGTDNAGTGYITYAAAMAAKLKNPKTLPDDGFIPYTDKHPDVKLNYNNADNTSSQTWFNGNVPGYFDIPVPQTYYSNMMLFFTSGASAKLTVTLYYSTGFVSKDITVPKYDDNTFETNPIYTNWFYLVKDVGKFTQTNVQKIADKHNINGIELLPDQNRILQKIRVSKPNNWLNFWGATGIALSGVGLKNITVNSILVYPNPATDKVNFKLPLTTSEVTVTIFDIAGNKMIDKTLLSQNGQYQFDISNFKSGLYVVRIADGKQQFQTKLNIQ